MNARLLQTSKPSSLEIQTHRNVDPLLRKQVVQLEAAQVIEKIGGRGRDRTGDPLLAKQVLSQLSYTPTVDVTFILKHLSPFRIPILRNIVICGEPLVWDNF
jgi:hypothetical protein